MYLYFSGAAAERRVIRSCLFENCRIVPAVTNYYYCVHISYIYIYHIGNRYVQSWYSYAILIRNIYYYTLEKRRTPIFNF